jgi:hypothetical protein
MPAHVDKKEAIRKYKELKPLLGVFAIRCTASGRVWVGASRNLDATRNGSWFTLRTGVHIEKSLQQEWNAHGEPAFQYEILETLDADVLPLAAGDLLKEKLSEWAARLSAQPIL